MQHTAEPSRRSMVVPRGNRPNRGRQRMEPCWFGRLPFWRNQRKVVGMNHSLVPANNSALLVAIDRASFRGSRLRSIAEAYSNLCLPRTPFFLQTLILLFSAVLRDQRSHATGGHTAS
jgi:hypothetical protein